LVKLNTNTAGNPAAGAGVCPVEGARQGALPGAHLRRHERGRHTRRPHTATGATSTLLLQLYITLLTKNQNVYTV